MTTQAATTSQDILQQARSILSQTVLGEGPAPAACCSSAQQEVCCEPAEKSSCCGTTSSGAGCGCQ